MGSSPVAFISDFAPVTSTEFLDIHANIECRFTHKCVGNMIWTYGQNQDVLIGTITVEPFKTVLVP